MCTHPQQAPGAWATRDARISPVPIACNARTHLAGCSGARVRAAAHVALCVRRCVWTVSAALRLLGQRARSQVQPTAPLQVCLPMVARMCCVLRVSGTECRYVSIAAIQKMLCRCGSRLSRTVFRAQGTRYVPWALTVTVCSGSVTCWKGLVVLWFAARRADRGCFGGQFRGHLCSLLPVQGCNPSRPGRKLQV